MNEMLEPKVCRLCLEFTDTFEILGDSEKNMLDEILPVVNINPFDECYICKSCSDHLLESVQFKRNCLEATANVDGFAKPQTHSVENPEHILVDGNPLVQEEASEICCLCCKVAFEKEAHSSLVLSEILLEMLEKCLPELEDSYSATAPAICENCACSLESMCTFINICLGVEEKIKNYCLINTVSSDGYINLYEVKSVKVETEDVKDEIGVCFDSNSCSSLVKIEPKGEYDDGSFLENNEEVPIVAANNKLDLEISSRIDFYEKALLLMLLLRRRRANKKRRRRFWVDPLGAERLKKGMYYNLYKDLREDEGRFFGHFGMSRASFDELLSIIKEEISGKDTVMRRCVPAEEKLALTVRYLGTGCSMKTLHYEFRLGVSTVSLVVHQVCKAISRLMKDICIPVPTQQRWLEIAEGFDSNLNFPNCIGAVDGKDVRLMKPRRCGTLFLLAICDSKYRFIYTEVGNSDVTTLRESELHKSCAEDALNIPRHRYLKGSSIATPFVFVAGRNFPIAKYLMRPFSGRNLTVKKKIFNYRLSRARSPIDCTFAIFSNKWKIFHRPLDVSLDFARDIVGACCVLHNFVLDRDGYDFEHTLMIEGFAELDRYLTQGGRAANGIRDELANYFLTDEGAVPWQQSRI